MARRKVEYTVKVVYESTPREVSERFTNELLRIYDKLSEEERERLCRRRLHEESAG